MKPHPAKVRKPPDALQLDKYLFLRKIASGSYGKVYEGVHLPSGKKVAIKKIKVCEDPAMRQKHLVLVARELEITYRLSLEPKNHFTVKLLDSFVQVKPRRSQTAAREIHNIYFVMEFFEHDLQSLLDDSEMSISED